MPLLFLEEKKLGEMWLPRGLNASGILICTMGENISKGDMDPHGGHIPSSLNSKPKRSGCHMDEMWCLFFEQMCR